MDSEEKKLINDLQTELNAAKAKIQYYEALLTQNGIPFSAQSIQSSENEKVLIPREITWEDVQLFMSVFRGRSEFYAKRTKYGTYLRPCWNRYDRAGSCPKQTNSKFPCKECKNQNFKRLSKETVYRHLIGEDPECSDVIGIYPVTASNTCWFLVFDFDDHNHKGIYENAMHDDTVTGQSSAFIREIQILSAICSYFEVPHLIERSRSGFGAHLWIFFDHDIPCADARRFGSTLLSEGMDHFNVTEFKTYDRMMPMQDSLESSQAGNLIALPLQGMALRQGNSVFTDAQFHAYKNQWDVIRNLRKYPAEALYKKLNEWQLKDPYGESSELYEEEGDPTKPWHKDQSAFMKSDTAGQMTVVLVNGVYIKKQNTNTRLRNRIRRLALYKNPEYFKSVRRNNEISHLKNPYYIYCGREFKDYIYLPRGCAKSLLEKLDKADIPYVIENKQERGKQIKVKFNGQLKENQKHAVSSLLEQDIGIISAATAFGKTVVGAALIAERKVNTLVLVNRSEILDGWFETLQEFLDIDAPLPSYKTKTGRVKTRESVIGRIGSGKNEANGLIDIAMVQSLVTDQEIKEEYRELIKGYGMVIVDECHHVAGNEYQEVLSTVMAQYVYGFSATPKRYDSQDKKMYFQLGPVRYKFSAKDRASEQNIDHLVTPRFTDCVNSDKDTNNYNELLKTIMDDRARDQMIIHDVISCIKKGRSPIILTKRIDHAEKLYDLLKNQADHVLLMSGRLSKKEEKELIQERKNIRDDESVILIATGSKAGEGFNYPRLDTLMLAAPVSWEGSIEQYAGRLNRDYPGKKAAIIFDYVDGNIPAFDRMYRKRLHVYKQIGFDICTFTDESPLEKGSFYDGTDFMPHFTDDIKHSRKNSVIFASYLSGAVLNSFISQLKESLINGVHVHIITSSSETMDEDFVLDQKKEVSLLKSSGFEVSLVKENNSSLNFAVIDNETVWYGSFSLLSKANEDDYVIRIKDIDMASKLLKKGITKAQNIAFIHSLQIRMEV